MGYTWCIPGLRVKLIGSLFSVRGGYSAYPEVDERGMRRLEESLGRAGVLRAAMQVFAAKGVKETRVQDLLEAAHIARRTFYKYFTGKEDVLRALYEHVTRELLSALEPDPEAADPLAAARAVLDGYLQFHVENPRITRLLVGEALREDSPLAPIRLRFREQLVTALSAAFEQATGRVLDPYLFIALISGLEGVSLALLRQKPDAAEVGRARAALEGLLTATLAHASLMPGARSDSGETTP